MVKLLILLIINLVFFYQPVKDKVKPNIIFYLADDQDQLDYGVYGNNLIKTPAVDKLANEGMLFTNAYTTQAICAPTRSMLYTGLYPMKNGCMANHLPVKDGTKDVNDFFNELGYEVILVGKSHVKPNSVFNWSNYFPNISTSKTQGFKKKIIPLKKIESYIRNSKKPFLMFIASDYPHRPYPIETDYTDDMIFKTPYDEKFPMYNKKGYYKNVESDNDQLRSLLEVLERTKINKNTLFIYAADHGITGKWGISEVGLKMPMIIKWPKFVKAGSISNELVNVVDILPTLIDIGGGKVPESLDGMSFKKTILKNKHNGRKFIYGISTRQNIMRAKIFPSRSIRDHKYKYIVNYNSIEIYEQNLGKNPIINSFIEIGAKSFPNTPHEEFYDLENDPYELNNLIDQSVFKKDIKQLKNELSKWMVTQKDFLISNKMPLIKPANFPLDKETNWNKVDKRLQGKIEESDYIESHY